MSTDCTWSGTGTTTNTSSWRAPRCFARCKLDVPDMIELGYRMVVIESKCRHVFPLRYGDKFRVSAWFKEIEYRLHVAFEVFNVTAERRAAKGHTLLATLDAAGNLLLATPAAMTTRVTRTLVDMPHALGSWRSVLLALSGRCCCGIRVGSASSIPLS